MALEHIDLILGFGNMAKTLTKNGLLQGWNLGPWLQKLIENTKN